MKLEKSLVYKPQLIRMTLLLILTGLLLAACGQAATETFTVGIINLSPTLNPTVDGFKTGMTEFGYVEGENITYIYEGPVGSVEALEPAIQKLVEAKVDLIFSASTPATLKTKAAVAGTDMPVVFAPVTDPVGTGIVDNLREPGGNLTGIKVGGFAPKALEWLHTIAPDATRIFLLHNPDDGSSVQTLAELVDAAPAMGVELVIGEVRTPDEAVASIEDNQEIGAVFILPSGQITAGATDIAETAMRRGLPTAATSELTGAGVLMTYGGKYSQVGEQAARLVDQVHKGTSPANLPVETSEFFLAINLETAQAIGLDIPDETLRQADDVIR